MSKIKQYTVVFKNGEIKRPMPGMSDEGIKMVKYSDVEEALAAKEQINQDTVRFTKFKEDYKCSKPGNMSGDYIPVKNK